MPNLATQHALIKTKPKSVMTSDSVGCFLDIGGLVSQREFGVFGKTPDVPQFLVTFHPCTQKSFLYSCPSCPCLEFCRSATTHANANNKKVASGTLDTRQKLKCFLKTATCCCIHLRCGCISVFQIAIKLFKKLWVICRRSNFVGYFLQLVIIVASVPFNIFFAMLVVIISILIVLLMIIIPGNCISSERRGF